MYNTKPKISIVIATRNSGWILERTLRSIKDQNYPHELIEIIVADNLSQDNTHELASKFGAKVISIEGTPPQVCVQRNSGAQKSSGDYVYMLDHDMALSENLLKNFSEKISDNPDIDAWYVPERIVGNSKSWSKIRTFERSFYNASIIDAARIIKREIFDKIQYDETLSNGPADWDFDIQLKKMGCKFGILDDTEYVEHQEQFLSLWKYLTKKVGYIDGGKKYQEKWKRLDKGVYEKIIKRQYGSFYRLIEIFFEKDNYKKVLEKPHLFIPMIGIRILVGIFYFLKK